MTCAYCGSLLPAGAMFCGDCGRRVAHDGATMPTMPVAAEPPAASAAPVFVHPPIAPTPERPREIVPPVGETFTLQFSTGESVTVTGSGLIGRNPWPEPGENLGQMVRVFDTGRSVSKSHLEFGQSDGSLWICDRFSSNGTVVTVAGEPRRCDPGKRVTVPRGARVAIGEQFFDVS